MSGAGAAGGDGGGNGGEGAPGGEQGKDGKNEFKPVTYNTQEELNAAFAERSTRAADTARKEALKAFEEAGATPDQAIEAWKAHKAAEDAKKDPAVREREARENVERELAEYKAKEARTALAGEVAKELKIGDTPIPANLLAGANKEEMVAHGQALIAFIEQLSEGYVRAPQYNPNQGYGGEQKVTSGDPLRNYVNTGQF